MKKRIIIGGLAILLLAIGYFTLDKLLFDGVKPQKINEAGFQANFYAPQNIHNRTAVVLIGGGQWGDYWGVGFARRGFVGLSLPYVGLEGLPKLPEEIPLEYFESALKWLAEQPQVNPDKILVMGASRNAELALVIASQFQELVSGAIVYSPSAVAWSNTVLPYNSDQLKPSWTYRGKAIDFVSMPKISGSNTDLLQTLPYWQGGLNQTEQVEKAIIKVEKIRGPLLLLSGKDDRVWPAAQMADMLENYLEKHSFSFPFHNIQYEEAGHLISRNPESKTEKRTGKMKVHGQEYVIEYGGTNEGDFKAKQDAKARIFQLLEGF